MIGGLNGKGVCVGLLLGVLGTLAVGAQQAGDRKTLSPARLPRRPRG